MEKLVKRAVEGDGEAFAELIKGSMQSLYKTAWVYLENDEDIADAVQDTVLTCYEKLGTLRNPKYFKTWMIRILINNCKNVLRKRSQHEQVWAQEAGCRDSDMDRCEWKQVLGCLEQTSREIVQLYYFEEFTVGEIASILDMNRNTVMTKLDRARKKLRSELKQ